MKLKSTLELARLCRDYALEKKAEAPIILDLRKVNGPSEWFLICTVHSDPQLKAVANFVEKSLKDDHGISPYATNGTLGSRWMILDYSDLLVHIMHQEKRTYYRLEDLWKDGKVVE